MRRWLFPLFLLLASSFAAAPKSVVKAPSAVATGSLVRLDTTGTVSDVPAVARIWSQPELGEPLFRHDGTMVGFLLDRPGTCVFILLASGTPEGAARPAFDVAFCTTIVTSAVPTPPLNPPTPTPSPASDPLSVAARTYLSGIPKGFRLTAADVRTGKVATIDALIAAIGDRRKSAGQSLTAEMDRRFKMMADAAGGITDLAGVATALETAAAAMEAVSP